MIQGEERYRERGDTKGMKDSVWHERSHCEECVKRSEMERKIILKGKKERGQGAKREAMKSGEKEILREKKIK